MEVFMEKKIDIYKHQKKKLKIENPKKEVE